MIRCILVMKAEATVVVLVEQPKAAPVQGDNILRVYKNVILGWGGKKVDSNEGCPDKSAVINLYYTSSRNFLRKKKQWEFRSNQYFYSMEIHPNITSF